MEELKTAEELALLFERRESERRESERSSVLALPPGALADEIWATSPRGQKEQARETARLSLRASLTASCESLGLSLSPMSPRESDELVISRRGSLSLMPTCQTFENVVEPISILDSCHFALVLIYNSTPTVLLTIFFSVSLALMYNRNVGFVLDAVEAEPLGWSAMGVPGARQSPPGPGPHGPEFVYGHRADLGERYASVPSMSVDMMTKGYYSFGIPGHPQVGMGMFHELMAVWCICTVFSYGLLTWLFFILYRRSTRPFGYWRYMCWPFSVVGYCAFSYYRLWRGVKGPQEYGGSQYFFAVVICTLLTMKFIFKAQHLFRAVTWNFLLLTAGFVALPEVVLYVIKPNIGKNEGRLVLIRLVLWPVAEELWLATLRWFLRSVPSADEVDEAYNRNSETGSRVTPITLERSKTTGCLVDPVDKSGAALTLLPIKAVMVLTGRLINFSLREYKWMLACSVGLFVIESRMRTTVGKRDKAYTAALYGCNREKRREIFNQNLHQKFRANIMVFEMMSDYSSITFGAILTSLLCVTNHPDDLPTNHRIMLNFCLQLATEMACCAFSTWWGVNRLKLPMVSAWNARTPEFIWAFPCLVTFASIIVFTVMMEPFFCPMRLHGKIVWQYC